MSDLLVERLADVVGGANVLTDEGLTAPYSTDWTRRWTGRCRCVVRPADTAEVAAVVRACVESGVPVVPQGGNTGLVGGSIPRGGEVVVSLRRLDQLGPVDTAAAQVTAGAGATLAALHVHVAKAGLAYGVDLAARDSATVGGTIATNAGGVNVVRHGATRSQVLGIEAVLADGTVLRRMDALAKDSTGYDLPGLFTGSEGTLGIVTAARLRLVPAPARRVVAVVGVADTGAALQVLAAVRDLPSLQAVEWFHRDGLEVVCAHGGLADPLPAPFPTYVLVECAGATDPAEDLAAALDSCSSAEAVAVAQDRPARERLWAYRERHAEALAAAGVPNKYDVAVPPEHLAEFERRARTLCAEHDATVYLFGHLAEGNIHANVLGADPDDEQLDDAMLRLVARFGGSISAEHGVGVAKVPWLALTRSDVDRSAMAAVKRALDPAGMMNPGVIFPAGATGPGNVVPGERRGG